MKHVLLALLMVFAGKAVAFGDSRPLAKHAIEVRTLLARCPSWEFLDDDDVDLRRGITHLYLKISRFDDDSVREGIRLYLDSFSSDLLASLDASGKLYAFYRVFFLIPSGFYAVRLNQATGQPEIQSFWGTPHRDTEVDLLWPYATANDGSLELQNVWSIQDRTGSGYSALSDFDTLLRRFGRRFPVRCQ